MKATWVRLASKCRSGSELERKQKFRRLFFMHHRNADETIFTLDGASVLCAVYFSPEAKDREQLKRVMRLIQERIFYASELLPDDSSKE